MNNPATADLLEALVPEQRTEADPARDEAADILARTLMSHAVGGAGLQELSGALVDALLARPDVLSQLANGIRPTLDEKLAATRDAVAYLGETAGTPQEAGYGRSIAAMVSGWIHHRQY